MTVDVSLVYNARGAPPVPVVSRDNWQLGSNAAPPRLSPPFQSPTIFPHVVFLPNPTKTPQPPQQPAHTPSTSLYPGLRHFNPIPARRASAEATRLHPAPAPASTARSAQRRRALAPLPAPNARPFTPWRRPDWLLGSESAQRRRAGPAPAGLSPRPRFTAAPEISRG